MKASLILMSHGNLAREVLASASMVAGEIPNAQSICMLDADGMELTIERTQKALNQWNDGRPVLFLVDVMGGTPSNVATQAAAQRENTAVVAGLNLAMVIEYALMDMDDLIAFADHIADMGRSSVVVVDIPRAGAASNDEEDEIELD